MRSRDPWDELDRRRPFVEGRHALLPDSCGGALLERRPERSWIVLDVRLSPVEQRCALAHELSHLDRGSARCIGSHPCWDGAVVQEERRVDEEVADWLVPQHDLWMFVEALYAEGQDVTTKIIAAEFQVTRHIARVALDLLTRRRGLRVA